MTTADTLLALAGRCEAAMGADRKLDAAIAVTCGTARDLPTFDRGFDTGAVPTAWSYEGCSLAQAIERHPERVRQAAIFYGVPAYTASLDAAMALAPDHSLWGVGSDIDGPYARCIAPVRDGYVNGVQQVSYAATSALALCAAALRAKAAMESRHD